MHRGLRGCLARELLWEHDGCREWNQSDRILVPRRCRYQLNLFFVWDDVCRGSVVSSGGAERIESWVDCKRLEQRSRLLRNMEGRPQCIAGRAAAVDSLDALFAKCHDCGVLSLTPLPIDLQSSVHQAWESARAC